MMTKDDKREIMDVLYGMTKLLITGQQERSSMIYALSRHEEKIKYSEEDIKKFKIRLGWSV